MLITCPVQAKPSPEELQQLAELTGVSNDSLQASLGDSWFPHRGLGSMPPTDPTLYRLYEVYILFYLPVELMFMHNAF